MTAVPFLLADFNIAIPANNVAQSLLTISTGNNVRTKVKSIRIDLFGAPSGSAPARIEVCRTNSAGAGTTAVLLKQHPYDPETLRTTGKIKLTGEPSVPATLDQTFCSPYSGSVTFDAADYHVVGGDSLSVRVFSAVACTAHVYLAGEE